MSKFTFLSLTMFLTIIPIISFESTDNNCNTTTMSYHQKIRRLLIIEKDRRFSSSPNRLKVSNRADFQTTKYKLLIKSFNKKHVIKVNSVLTLVKRFVSTLTEKNGIVEGWSCNGRLKNVSSSKCRNKIDTFCSHHLICM